MPSQPPEDKTTLKDYIETVAERSWSLYINEKDKRGGARRASGIRNAHKLTGDGREQRAPGSLNVRPVEVYSSACPTQMHTSECDQAINAVEM